MLLYERKTICKKITIEIIDNKRLVNLALNDKIDWEVYYKENYDFKPSPDKKTLERWVVNYIRHNLVDYDEELERLRGRIGKGPAYILFKKNILLKIAEVYPKYSSECKRQIDAMLKGGV